MRNAQMYRAELDRFFSVMAGTWNLDKRLPYNRFAPSALYFGRHSVHIGLETDLGGSLCLTEITGVVGNEYRFKVDLYPEDSGTGYYVEIQNGITVSIGHDGTSIRDTYRKDISAILQIINSLLLDE